MDILFGLAIGLPVTASTAIATVTGVAEGVSHQQKVNKENANESRQLKFHVDVVSKSSALSGGVLTLGEDQVWIHPRSEGSSLPKPEHHPFTGFYLPYPDPERGQRGLVSTISRDPPVLNWIYCHKEHLAFQYGNRTQSIEHHIGDWDWTPDEERITFDDWEGFVAVKEPNNQWGLYFDMHDNGLEAVKAGRKVVEVTLKRRTITEQEVNKWGLGASGNLGVKKTEHQVKGKDMMDKMSNDTTSSPFG